MRTALHFEFVAVSLAAAGLSAALARALGSARGAFAAKVAGVAPFMGLVGAACWPMQVADEMPDGLSAALLLNFRPVSLGMQAIVWATVGLDFGFSALARPLLEGARRAHAPQGAATAR